MAITDLNSSEERAETPAQHLPPSLPSSPLPKRIKPDSEAIAAAQMPDDTPTPSNARPPPPQPGAFPQPGPTPTTTLPSVSAMLPNVPPPPTQAAVLGPTSHIGAVPSGPFVPALAAPPPIPPLLVQKLHDSATTPTRGSAFAAGYDLYAASEITIPSKGKALVSTALAIAVPAGTYGRVAPRSGLASKHFIDTGAGVIDADYRGEVKVLLFNFSDVDYVVKQGERVAQLVLERIVTPDVLVVDKLEDSLRGAGGFGSTGYA